MCGPREPLGPDRDAAKMFLQSDWVLKHISSISTALPLLCSPLREGRMAWDGDGKEVRPFRAGLVLEINIYLTDSG